MHDFLLQRPAWYVWWTDFPSPADPSPKSQWYEGASPIAANVTVSGAPPSVADTCTVTPVGAAAAAGPKLRRATPKMKMRRMRDEFSFARL